MRNLDVSLDMVKWLGSVRLSLRSKWGVGVKPPTYKRGIGDRVTKLRINFCLY